MKRILYYGLMVLLTCLVLLGCNGTAEGELPEAVDTVEASPTLAATDTPVPSPTPEPTAVPELSSAEDILMKSADAMSQVETMQYTFHTSMEIGGQTLTTGGEGAFQKPETMYMKMNVFGQQFEVLTLGAGEVYLKMPGADSFSLATPESMAQIGEPFDARSQSDILGISSEATLEGEETMDGIPMYVVAYQMDMEKYAQKDPSGTAGMILTESSGEGKAWIGKENGYLYKTTMNMTLSVQGNKLAMLTEMQFSDFNEPVEIPQP